MLAVAFLQNRRSGEERNSEHEQHDRRLLPVAKI
jgi:hypothetical protein